MIRLTVIATACVLAVLAVLATTVRAQESNTNDRTFMTFSSAVELPGVTLEPGTYEFRLADNDKQNVVQVFRKDSRDVIGQWMFVPTERPRVSDDTLVMFRETREGATPAVQYWYFPNEKIGKEFIYPKDQAQKIAARTGQTVRSENGPVSPAATASASREPAPAAAPERPVAAADANRQIDAAEKGDDQPVSAQASAQNEPSRRGEPIEPAPRPVGTSGSNAQPNPPDAGAPSAAAPSRNDDAQQPQQVARASELPKTASPLPISGLIGLLSLAGAAGMRAFRAR